MVARSAGTKLYIEAWNTLKNRSVEAHGGANEIHRITAGPLIDRQIDFVQGSHPSPTQFLCQLDAPDNPMAFLPNERRHHVLHPICLRHHIIIDEQNYIASASAHPRVARS